MYNRSYQFFGKRHITPLLRPKYLHVYYFNDFSFQKDYRFSPTLSPSFTNDLIKTRLLIFLNFPPYMINVYYVGPTRLLGLLLIYSKHIVSGIFVPNLWKDGQIF